MRPAKRPWLSPRTKREARKRFVADAIARGHAVMQLRTATPAELPGAGKFRSDRTRADVRRVVAKMAPELGAAVARQVAPIYAARIADLERTIAKMQAATAPAAFFGYVDPQSREFVPLPPEEQPGRDRRRDVGKGAVLAAAAAALPEGALRSEIGKAAAALAKRPKVSA